MEKIYQALPNLWLKNVKLSTVLTKENYLKLPPTDQELLKKLLPVVDQSRDNILNPSALNNVYFLCRCQEWTQRLENGDFTVKKNDSNSIEEFKNQS